MAGALAGALTGALAGASFFGSGLCLRIIFRDPGELGYNFSFLYTHVLGTILSFTAGSAILALGTTCQQGDLLFLVLPYKSYIVF